MNYQQRHELVSNLKGVDNVEPQTTPDYRPNLRRLKPDYVVHGNDWGSSARQQVTDTLSEWGGEVIELEYTEGISSTLLQQKLKVNGISPEVRLGQLKRMLQANKLVRGLEAQTILWDIAALTVIVREAGGSITQLNGKPIDHTATSALATNGQLHDDIVERFRN